MPDNNVENNIPVSGEIRNDEIVNVDKKIWNDQKTNFINSDDFVEGSSTDFPSGTKLVVYSTSSKIVLGYYFASQEKFWIKYKEGVN